MRGTIVRRSIGVLIALIVAGSAPLPVVHAQSKGDLFKKDAPQQSTTDQPRALFTVRAGMQDKTTLEQGHFRYDVEPGSELVDQFVVTNNTSEPMTVRVYPADMIRAKGGALAPAQESDPREHVGAWVHVETPRIEVPPHATVEDPFTIRVPEGSVPGEYLGAVVAAVRPGGETEGIGVETRAALLVRVRVPGTIAMDAEVVGLRSSRDGDEQHFEVDVRNTGNVLFTVAGEIEVSSGGDVVARLPIRPEDVYVIPDGSATFTADWTKLPSFGRYSAHARVQVLINGDEAGEFQSRAIGLMFIPWRLVGSATSVLILIAALLLVVRRRRRSFKAEKQEVTELLERLREREAAIRP